jgi:endonuclease YncB( thermonuclease family)
VQAEVTPQAQDRYGRTVAHVQCRGRDAGAAQVADGMAWVYRKYSKDGALLRLEREAGDARRGLWSDPAPVPPWEWRKNSKSMGQPGIYGLAPR